MTTIPTSPTTIPTIATARRRLAALAAAGVLLLGACSGSDSADDTSPAVTDEPVATDEPAAADGGAEIVIERSRYVPGEIEVAVGEEVVFTSLDPFAHTVTATDDSPTGFDSGEFVEGEPFSISFDEAGTYPFFCQIHPTMRGTITVG